ncbi:glycosyltransferase [Corynebacterium sp. H128]|uniref:glycosyltransferase n=1 Tax=Corynebacterium sp. H128 TaxID=3133427 RepID=UPI0030A9F0A5
MRVLVTGASGFVGRHLVERLSGEHFVVAGSRAGELVLGAHESRKIPALSSSSDWSGLLSDIDVIVHLAARVHVLHETADDPLEAFREANVRGTIELFKSAAAQGVRRFVYVSSIGVNGEQTLGRPFADSDAPNPSATYAVSKLEAEVALMQLSRDFSMDLVVLRPPVVYGAGAKGNIEKITKLVNTRLPLPLGSADNRRTMISVGNLSTWIARAISEPDVPSGPLLVSDLESVSTKDLVRHLADAQGIKCFLFPVPLVLFRRAASLVGKPKLYSKLFGDLEISPSVSAFPGIEDQLESPRQAFSHLKAARIARCASSRVIIGVTHHTALMFHEALAKRLKQRGYEVHLISAPGDTADRLSKEFVVHQVAMERRPNLVEDIKSLLQFVKVLRQIRPDAVLFGTPKASLLGLLSASILRVPVRIYWVHGLRLETAEGLAKRVFLLIEKIVAASATSVCAVSNSVYSKLRALKIGNAEKITLLGRGSSQGVNMVKFHPRSGADERETVLRSIGLDPNKYTIGFVGRLTAEKGVNELSEALALLPNVREEVQLIVLGEVEDASGEQLLARAASLGIQTAALGHVAEVASFYKGMDLFCLPTYREGLVTVILEAFASRVPVVSTRVTGVVDLVEDGRTGLLVAPRDAESLAAAMLRVWQSQALASELADNAFQFVQENYEESKVVDLQEEFLVSLLAKR